MKNNKGQLSIFVLFGIVILIAVSLLFYINQKEAQESPEVEKPAELSFSTVPIKNFVEICIESVGEDALEFIGKRGGYFDLPKLSTSDFFVKTPYYFFETKDITPSKETVEKEISKYMDNMLFFCLRNFIAFKEQGFEIQQGNANTKTIIQPNQVTFEVLLPLIIGKGETVQDMSEFIETVENVRLKTIYEVSKNITVEQAEHPDSICLSCILNLAIENDLYIDMERLDNSTILFIITDNNSIVYQEPYTYVFANKYEEVSCKNVPEYWEQDRKFQFIADCLQQGVESAGYSLKIKEIPSLSAIVGQEFAYDVNASGVDLVFSDYTHLFDINKETGIIRFTPKEEDIGDYMIWIKVKDDFGNEDYADFNLTITN